MSRKRGWAVRPNQEGRRMASWSTSTVGFLQVTVELDVDPDRPVKLDLNAEDARWLLRLLPDYLATVEKLEAGA